MTASVRLPRMLSETVGTHTAHQVTGDTVRAALSNLFEQVPGLRNHIVDEGGSVRPHVSVFVDGHQADLDTDVSDGSDIRVLNAVSGGSSTG
jgi:molybdopterin converting factor small subunit